MTANDMERFLEICLAITGERDREVLLSRILDTAMDLADCDAGTLYLMVGEKLHFYRMVTRSMHVRKGGPDDPISLPPVPPEEKYVCAWAALHNETISVADVRSDSRFDFTGSIEYDRLTGYHTVSMLVVPLSNDRGELIGVMQLINALDPEGGVIPFDHEIILLESALASQAAISIANMQYSEQISELLDSLVRALSMAIDQRSHYTVNHTKNMAAVAERFLDWLERTDIDWRFDDNRRRSFIMSVWLHDVGKLVIPAEIMDKATRLGSAFYGLEDRLRVKSLLDRIELLDGRIPEDEYERRKTELESTRELVARVNVSGFLTDADRAAVEELSGRTFTDENGTVQPWITENEKECLLIPRGTLTAGERAVMESHAAITGQILGYVSFPKAYAQVPVWAASHHELLNGRGYPRHLTAESIPRETRLLTILDVFDSLIAADRPYKKPMTPDQALSILDKMADEGAVDREILDLFRESRAWEGLFDTGKEVADE